MKTELSILISLLSCVICGAESVTFPVRAGKYAHKGWEYVYEVELKGTRSEKRIGRLFLNGKEIKGKIGELNQEPIGIFIYFGESGYNQGWLNTLTYDEAVFAEDGSPTPEVTSLLQALRAKKTKAEDAPSNGGQRPSLNSGSRPRRG
jgi:hypothetical protein